MDDQKCVTRLVQARCSSGTIVNYLNIGRDHGFCLVQICTILAFEYAGDNRTFNHRLRYHAIIQTGEALWTT